MVFYNVFPRQSCLLYTTFLYLSIDFEKNYINFKLFVREIKSYFSFCIYYEDILFSVYALYILYYASLPFRRVCL